MSGQASIEEAREELGYMRADVLRVAAGLVANPNLGNLFRGRDVEDDSAAAAAVAETALAVVRAVDRVCGVGS